MGDVISFPAPASVFRDGSAWLRYGRRREAALDLEEAETAYAMAAFIDPACAQAWEAMARLLARQGRQAEAQVLWERAAVLADQPS